MIKGQYAYGLGVERSVGPESHSFVVAIRMFNYVPYVL